MNNDVDKIAALQEIIWRIWRRCGLVLSDPEASLDDFRLCIQAVEWQMMKKTVQETLDEVIGKDENIDNLKHLAKRENQP